MNCFSKASAALFVALGLLTPALGSAAEPLELNFQSQYSGPHVLNVNVYQPGCENMEKLTNGELKLHYFMNGALVRAEEVAGALINGNLDMGGTGIHYQDQYFPHTLALQLPHISKDSRHASAIYWKAYNEIPEVKAEIDKVGKLLTIFGSDRSAIFSAKGPIMSPADMKGKRVLIWNGGQVDQVKSWGGIPVQVNPNDTYMGLQRGMGDAFLGPLPVGVAYKVMEVAKDVTVFPATTVAILDMVNWEVWNEMTPASQKAMMDTFGGEAGSIRAGQGLYDGTNRDIETMKKGGCTIHTLTDEQYATFEKADAEVMQAFWIKDLTRLGVKDPEAWIKQIRALSDELAVTY